MVADYPLQLTEPGDKRIRNTYEYLWEHCMVHGGFFQDMIHSGINAYLTLDLAQTLLRFGDSRYWDLVESVAELASPTGNWPEAIHPGTRGGCMGDGQHGWAAAEWTLMMRSLFIREEGEHLVLCPGIRKDWYGTGETLFFGPTLTPWGRLSIRVSPGEHHLRIDLEGKARSQPRSIRVAPPGCKPGELSQIPDTVELPWEDS